jgi:ribosomal protein L37E
MRAVAYESLKQGCVDCGFSDIRALQFDHVRGTKSGEISQMIRRGVSERVLREEISKCEVRCANCHMIVTTQRRATDWHNEYL